MKLAILIIQCAILSLVTFKNTSYADNRYFPQPVNFQQTAYEARNKNIPIMVLMSSVHCDYCKFIKREFLVPMIISGDYKDKVIIRVVEDDISDEVIDFNGDLIEAGNFSDRYKINFTPTAILIDYQGNELSNRIIGLESEEYYGSLIDESISHSLIKIRNK